jgi:hypothetical protein
MSYVSHYNYDVVIYQIPDQEVTYYVVSPESLRSRQGEAYALGPPMHITTNEDVYDVNRQLALLQAFSDALLILLRKDALGPEYG